MSAEIPLEDIVKELLAVAKKHGIAFSGVISNDSTVTQCYQLDNVKLSDVLIHIEAHSKIAVELFKDIKVK
jgi:hypothetical protein